MANIKQVNLGTASTPNLYDIEALHFITGDLDTPAQWKNYIDTAVSVGIQIETDEQAVGKEEPATTASATTMGKLYFVQIAGTESGTYTEFITLDKGSGSPRYVWEKIGTTATDLSEYAKAGTYTTTSDGSGSTGEGGAQTATGTATVSYKKSATETGSTGATTTANTSEVAAQTIQGSSFSFTGTTASITLTTAYTPGGSITGSQALTAHSHTVHASTASITYVTGVKASGGTASALTGVKATGTETFVTGYASFNGGSASLSTKNYGFASSVTGVMYSPTVSTLGVLSWSTVTANTQDALTFTPASLGTASTATAITGVGADGTATVILNTGLTTTTATFATGATLGTTSGGTVDFTKATFSGTSATISVSGNYQPAGSIGGTASVPKHSHTYVELKAHTHSITLTDTNATGSVEVAVSNHTHTIGNHTHNVTISN